MIGIYIDERTKTPKYKQIKEQIIQNIASDKLHAGELIPTRKELSKSLHVTQVTIGHAFRELIQEGIISSRRRRGTVVLGAKGDSQTELRKKYLNSRMNDLIFNSLSMSYSPEELETAFYSTIARWRLERDLQETNDRNKVPAPSCLVRT
jgi:GntR family transcriptional regulator